MAKAKSYILAWHDEGETNRAETIWEGYDPKEARKRFNEVEFSDDVFFIELWAIYPDYEIDSRIDFKCR